MKTAFAMTLAMIAATACNSPLAVSGNDPTKTATINSLDQLSAKPGDELTIKGTNLSEGIEVLVNNVPANFHRIDSKSATVEIPPNVDPGLIKITFSDRGKQVGAVTVMNSNSIEAMSRISIPLDNICDSYIVKDDSGDLARGKAKCNLLQNLCTTEGQTGCTTSADVPSAAKSHIASSVLQGQTVAGVSGTAVLPATCN
jgi:hypothetical protein